MFGTVSALIARKNTGVYYVITFQHYHVTQRLVGHNSVGSKTKSIRPGLRPRPKLQDQDRGRSETNLVIRPWSQTPRVVSSSVCFVLSVPVQVISPFRNTSSCIACRQPAA